MKIICDSLDEYDKLMRASKYFHDFRVTLDDFASDFTDDGKPIDFKDRIVEINLNDGIINFLAHLYLTEDDFPDKREKVVLETNY